MNCDHRLASRRIAFVAVLCLAASVAQEAPAQEQPTDPVRQTQEAESADPVKREQRSATRQPPRPTIVVGQLAGIRDVSSRKDTKEHRLLRLKTEGGTVVVDMGETADLGEEISFDEGDRLIVIGTRGRANTRPVLYATSIGELHRVRTAQERDALIRKFQLRQAESEPKGEERSRR